MMSMKTLNVRENLNAHETLNTRETLNAHKTMNTHETMNSREAMERLELLQVPKVRMEEKLRERHAYEDAFARYVMFGTPQNALKKEPESAGGYLVPETMERRIVEKLNERNVLRQICKVVQTTQDMTIPVVASHGQAFCVPEGEALPLSDDQFAHVSIGAYKVGTSEIISSELLEDSVIDMDKLITDSFAERIADTEEDAFLNGDGNGKPVGLLTQASVGAVTESSGKIVFDDVINLIHSVEPMYRKNGILLMNDITFSKLYKIKNHNDQSVWRRDLKQGDMEELFGHPILISDKMPNPESGNKAIAFGDFSCLWIGDRGHHHLKRLNELRAKNDQVEFMLTKRTDAKLVYPEAITTLQIA